VKLINASRTFFLILMCASIIACTESKPLHVPSYLQDTLKNDSLGPKLAIITTGTGVVGGENFRSFQNQSPQHKVISTQEFAIGIAEVTFKEFDAFCKSTFTTCPDDNGWGRGDQLVINVSWLDAMAYTE
jgi:formylglycine-generating enzyme required for sulfatase activity